MYKSNSSIFSNYNIWLNAVKNDKKTFDELKSIENDEKEITDRFYCDLKFGTGGLRGKLGAGTNRMNVSKFQADSNYKRRTAKKG